MNGNARIAASVYLFEFVSARLLMFSVTGNVFTDLPLGLNCKFRGVLYLFCAVIAIKQAKQAKYMPKFIKNSQYSRLPGKKKEAAETVLPFFHNKSYYSRMIILPGTV